MEDLRRMAFLSIGRGCGFAGLAILCVMIGLTFDPLIAVRSGAVLMTLSTMVLLLKARQALTQDVRRTEMWILLEEGRRPAPEHAQWAGATVLRDAYLWFAQYAAGLSVLLWTAALAISLSQRL
ncbi:hypothetical protein [Microbaculum marinum]|uniref:Uncharacterized protein n=1 Tax=Microbaculum marinum TaxID=1764581 RepID=A0AAW9RPX1_9HYPH